jgi:hypothetical protein
MRHPNMVFEESTGGYVSSSTRCHAQVDVPISSHVALSLLLPF